MILFPAIDLKDGQCVRLVRGLMEEATVFNDDPAAQARAFEAAGFEYLHLVDLNGAISRGEKLVIWEWVLRGTDQASRISTVRLLFV